MVQTIMILMCGIYVVCNIRVVNEVKHIFIWLRKEFLHWIVDPLQLRYLIISASVYKVDDTNLQNNKSRTLQELQ